MASAAFTKIVVNGKTAGDIQRLGIKLKPLHEVRLKQEDGCYIKGLLHQATVRMSHGKFDNIGKIGLSSAFYPHEIAIIAQNYQKYTSHKNHVDNLRMAAGFSWFKTAMVILEAAKNLDNTDEDRGTKIHKSITMVRKIADGTLIGTEDKPVGKLEGEELEEVLAIVEEVGRVNRKVQHDYPFTHRKNTNGDWEQKKDDRD